jgi:hypothetical protein
MLMDNFLIVVSTVLESDRIERLFRYFHDAGIERFMLDYEPKFTGEPPIPFGLHGWYGASQHFCEIQAKFPGQNIICFEDDAILKPDFCTVMDRHLAELPDDWRIFAAGYTHIWEFPETLEGENCVTDNIRRNIDSFWGTQCLVVRSCDWRDVLTAEMRNYRFYFHAPGNGHDTCMAKWCRANEIPFYAARQSFVGQGGCVSLISGQFIEQNGLQEESTMKPKIKAGQQQASASSNLVELLNQYSRFTDKQSVHAYRRLYEQWIRQLDSVDQILELGVSLFGGGSLLALADRFPSACIIRCDITLSNIIDDVKERPCVHLFCGDIYQKDVMERFRNEYPQDFDVVIDDAVRSTDHQYAAFLLWSPFVSPQGCYVIEDVNDISVAVRTWKKHFPELTDARSEAHACYWFKKILLTNLRRACYEKVNYYKSQINETDASKTIKTILTSCLNKNVDYIKCIDQLLARLDIGEKSSIFCPVQTRSTA